MTRQVSPCIHGGGTSCERQGGSGEASHGSGYTHAIPTLREVGRPAGDPVEPLATYVGCFVLKGLEEFFDDDFSKSVLGVSLDTAIHALEVVKKSLYDFDLETEEGVTKLLEMLPIMDREIISDIASEIWPGYPAQDLNPQLLRLEIKGYMMDYLDGHGTQEAATAPEGLGEPTGEEEGAEGQEAPAPTGSPGVDDAGDPPEQGPPGAEGAPETGAPDDEPAPGPGDEA